METPKSGGARRALETPTSAAVTARKKRNSHGTADLLLTSRMVPAQEKMAAGDTGAARSRGG